MAWRRGRGLRVGFEGLRGGEAGCGCWGEGAVRGAGGDGGLLS